MRPLQRCASGLFIGILASTGCKCPLSPGHCFNNQGDQTCGEGKYCDSCNPEGNGCVDVRPPDDCHYSGPEEVETGSTSDIETTNDGPTTAEPTTTAEATESSTGEMCTSNDHCEDPETPFCRPDGECVACDEMEDHDGACAGLDQGVQVALGVGPHGPSGETPVEEGECCPVRRERRRRVGGCHVDRQPHPAALPGPPLGQRSAALEWHHVVEPAVRDQGVHPRVPAVAQLLLGHDRGERLVAQHRPD